MQAALVVYLAMGVILILAGWVYMYKVSLVFKINQLVKTHIFNDALVLTEHRKIGLFLLFLAVIFLYLGFSKIEVRDFEGIDAHKEHIRRIK